MNSGARILVLRGGAIGDFILTLPALQALRRAWPDAHLEIAGYPHIAELARLGGLADRIASLHQARIARLYVLGGPLDAELREYLAGFDRIVSFLHDPDGSVARNLKASGVPEIVCIPPVSPPGHAADHLLGPVARFAGLPAAPAVPRLALDDPARTWGRDWARRNEIGPAACVLHPGSGSPGKNWPPARFFELAERLRRAGDPPVFSLGEADAPIAPDVRAFCREKACPLLENAELVQTASLLAACGRYVGNDSGITHLAAALGLRTVALFGPSDPRTWGPRGDRVRVLRSADGTMDAISVEAVEAETHRTD